MNQLIDILNNGRKKLAILIDPEKAKDFSKLKELLAKIELVKPAFIFVGGSTVSADELDKCMEIIQANTTIPTIIFPGAHHQINEKADGLLFLSLLSGRNPDYLIGHQIQAATLLKKMDIEIIPTAYLLIDGEKASSVAYVSQTNPIPNDQDGIAVNTAIAGEMLGFKTIFLDAGSGAKTAVPDKMISSVKKEIKIPLIVGGGIKSVLQIKEAFEAGADIVVIGNKIEDDVDFLLDITSYKKTLVYENI